MSDQRRVFFYQNDHLGSATVTLNPDGSTAETRYTAWGQVRFQSGTTQTDRTYTGQRSYVNDFGLMFYNARWYDSQLGRFAQADTIVQLSIRESGLSIPLVVSYSELSILSEYNNFNHPNDEKKQTFQPPNLSQNLDRYSYVSNNPIQYNDPTGHCLGLLGGADTAACALGLAAGPPGWVADAAVALIEIAAVVVVGVTAIANIKTTVDNAASSSDSTMEMRGEYIPDILSGEAERNAYREALHLYKSPGWWGLGAKEDVPEEILDRMAELIKEGKSPVDAADGVDGPPEDDLDP